MVWGLGGAVCKFRRMYIHMYSYKPEAKREREGTKTYLKFFFIFSFSAKGFIGTLVVDERHLRNRLKPPFFSRVIEFLNIYYCLWESAPSSK